MATVIRSTYVTDCADCGGDLHVVEDVEQPHDCPRYRRSEDWLEAHPEDDPYWWRPVTASCPTDRRKPR